MRTAPVKKSHKKLTYLPGAKQVPVKKRLTSWLLLFAVLYFTVLFGGQYWRLMQLQHSLDSIYIEIEAVKSKNDVMMKEIERLHSPAYLEQLAREDLGMVRSGELLFYFQQGDNPTSEQE
ncbi:MAG: septum formation initiator family protein [Firmicutes bacterium]|nr:septum formation initiator family protein [Bacillota bacterium]